MNIASLLQEQARRAGDRPAIVEPGRSITYAQLDTEVAAAAADLAAAGVEPGMRALVFSRMSVALYVTMIALFRRRVTAVFVDPSAGRSRLEACIRRVQPDAFVAIPRAHLLRFTSRAIRAIPRKLAIGGRVPFAATVGHRSEGDGPPIESCTAETPAIITFTSGSTGEPKAAVRTHGFLLAQHRALVGSIALEPGQVDLCTLPIFLLANLASGITSVIPDADLRSPGAIDPGPVLEQVSTLRPDRTVASPALLLRLSAHAVEQGRPLDSFTRIYTGGAPVFPATLDAIARAAPLAAVVAVYGSTEAEPIAEIDRGAISAADRAAMTGGAGLLAGRPVDSIQVRIMPDRWGTPVGPLSPAELDTASLPATEIGEIVVSGEHVLESYLDGHGDDETKIRVLDRTWHRTGDAGYFDAAGRLWLLGRCSAKARDKEGVLYPFAVECAASEHPRVARAAFAFHRDERVLAVELREPSANTPAELRRRLEWARLDRVVTVDRIPVDRRHNAKVDYTALTRILDRE
jgi:acyl-CoA synthetase (AMP-forming)/AMP-acid ligase II